MVPQRQLDLKQMALRALQTKGQNASQVFALTQNVPKVPKKEERLVLTKRSVNLIAVPTVNAQAEPGLMARLAMDLKTALQTGAQITSVRPEQFPVLLQGQLPAPLPEALADQEDPVALVEVVALLQQHQVHLLLPQLQLLQLLQQAQEAQLQLA